MQVQMHVYPENEQEMKGLAYRRTFTVSETARDKATEAPKDVPSRAILSEATRG